VQFNGLIQFVNNPNLRSDLIFFQLSKLPVNNSSLLQFSSKESIQFEKVQSVKVVLVRFKTIVTVNQIIIPVWLQTINGSFSFTEVL
jgi:hypothetical protein